MYGYSSANLDDPVFCSNNTRVNSKATTKLNLIVSKGVTTLYSIREIRIEQSINGLEVSVESAYAGTVQEYRAFRRLLARLLLRCYKFTYSLVQHIPPSLRNPVGNLNKLLPLLIRFPAGDRPLRPPNALFPSPTTGTYLPDHVSIITTSHVTRFRITDP